ncbi:hypothetical protein KGI17_15825 [Lactiplantibacillus pentosus]|uniref:hypothetical protein n=1 Tax=Lactiplantibacillus pentosus TaxID=1589 RepID=UPI0020A6FD5E|nr:hypothetical protein [Lactiplantibacillus pentosus]MBU7465882.1 hypothetical protein [Lactiplantibacillus pentosus]MDT7002295.1 hypothetical protein [Lactiplantibacillus pentosus]
MRAIPRFLAPSILKSSQRGKFAPEPFLGLSDAIMIHFHDGNRQAMKSLIDWSGVLRRELIHAGAEPEDIDDIDNVMNELPDAVYWGQN